MPRELSKCREWEKDRRERLKKGFASLSKVLPCYEPSINLSKIDILQKAEAYIEELQTQIKELLDKKSTKIECNTIKKLSDRVKKLAIRNEQLCNLLIEAGIRLPSECGNVKKFRGTRIWSNKISHDQAKKLLKKEKDNEQKKVKKKVQNKIRKTKKAGLQKKLRKKPELNKPVIITNQLQSTNFITLVTTQSCFIITNAPSTNVNQNLCKTTTVLTNSNLFSTPLVASTVKPPLVITKSSSGPLNTVTSGTLLVANGSLLPIIQQPTLIPAPTIINPTPIVVKSAATNNPTTLFVVPKTDTKETANNKTTVSTLNAKIIPNAKTANVTKQLAVLRPKINDVSYPNKVPIPPLTSKTNEYISHISTSQSTKCIKNKSNKKAKKETTAKSNKEDGIQNEKVIEKPPSEGKEVKKPSSNNKKDTNENEEPIPKKIKLNTNVTNESNDDKRTTATTAYSIDSLCNDLGDIPNTTTAVSVSNEEDDIKETEKEITTGKEMTLSEISNVDKQNEECAIIPQTELVLSETSQVNNNQTAINSAIVNESKENEALDKDKDKTKEQKDVETNNSLMHSDLSNDIFASLSHVSAGGQNPESTSPTAAFLLAFPLVSSLNSLKVTEVIEDDATESQHGTPTLLQIGTMDTTKTTQSLSDTLTPSLLNMDNFSFFSREFYPPFEPVMTPSVCSTITSSTISSSSFVYPPITSSSAIYPAVTFSSIYSPVTSSPTVYSSVTSSAYPVVTSLSVKYPAVSTTAAYTTTSNKHTTPISSSSYTAEVSSSAMNSLKPSSTLPGSAKHPVMSSSIAYSHSQPSSVQPPITSSKIVTATTSTSSIYPTTTSTSFIYPATTSTSSVYPATLASPVVNSSVFSTTSIIHPAVRSSVQLAISSVSSSVTYSAASSSITSSVSNQSTNPTRTSSFEIYPTSSIYSATTSSSMYPVIPSAYPAITASSALNSSIYSTTTSSSTIRPAITSSTAMYPVVVSSVYPGISLSSNQSLYSPTTLSSSVYPIVTSSAYPAATSLASIYPAITTSYPSVTSSIYPVLTSSSTVYSSISSSSAVHPIVSSTYQPVTSSTSAICPITTSSLSLAVTSTSAVYPCVTSSAYSAVVSSSSSVSYPIVNSSVNYQVVNSSTYSTVASSSVYPIVTSSIAIPAAYPIVSSSVCPAVTTCSTVSSIVPKVVDIKKEFVDFHASCGSKKLLNSDINPKDDMKFSLKSVSNKDSFPYLNDKTCVNQSSVPVSGTTAYMNRTSTDYNSSYVHPFYTNAQTLTSSSSTAVTSAKHQVEKSKISDKKTCNYYPTTTSYSVPQYNTFNPFTDIPKTTTTYSITTKAYNDTLYTNNSTYSYNYHHDNFTAYPPTKSNLKADKLYYGLNYDNYEYKNAEFQQQFGNYYVQNNIQNKEKSNESNKNNLATSSNINKVPVNWMTTPDIRQQPQNDFIVPSLGKDVDFTPNPIYSTSSFNAPQSTYFNANTNLYPSTDLHSNAAFPTIPPNSFQRNEVEENQFSWSPSKLPQLLDTSHNFVSSTLPTLVGDLALGNTQSFVDQKIEKKDFRSKENMRRSKSQTNYDNNQSNFLSVSQLVDHNKSDTVPERVTNRRSSGNRSTKPSAGGKSNKRAAKTEKEIHYNSNTGNNNNKVVEKQIKRNTIQEYQTQSNENNTSWVTTNKNRNIKMPSSSYSAEALIGHQNQPDRTRNSQNYPVNKSLPVPFLPDNIIPYFPMDIPQENTLTQQNQNYQTAGAFGHNFSTGIQGGVYSTNSFVPNAPPITTSYLPSTNFIPDLGCGAEYAPIIPDNTFSHVMNRPSDKFSKSKPLHNEKQNDKRNTMQTNNCPINTGKKSKKKQNNEPNLSNFDFNFLSVPAAINSPILPDDFHTHSNFLPPPTPTQLYPCKNPLYGKQDLTSNSLLPLHASTRSGIPHPEASPSLNNVGNTLTNFNLSTIFPEINKVSGPIADVYSNNGKAKEYNQRNFLGGTSQVPFKSNMSYINSPTSNNN